MAVTKREGELAQYAFQFVEVVSVPSVYTDSDDPAVQKKMSDKIEEAYERLITRTVAEGLQITGITQMSAGTSDGRVVYTFIATAYFKDMLEKMRREAALLQGGGGPRRLS